MPAVNTRKKSAAAAVGGGDYDDGVDGGAASMITSPLTSTTWPDCQPHVSADHLLVVVCGNSRVQWSLHEGFSEGFRPSLFWRTSLFPTEFTADMDPCTLLDSYIPGTMQTILFGSSDPDYEASVAVSAAHRATKRIPVMNVYVVSTHPEQELAIHYLFRDLPCNVYKMQAHDFFSTTTSNNDESTNSSTNNNNNSGVYPGLGVDRVATLLGAQHLLGSPVLVLDGGTAMTYTGLDANDLVVGGGISVGLQSKLDALPPHLPCIKSMDILDRLKQQQQLWLSLVSSSSAQETEQQPEGQVQQQQPKQQQQQTQESALILRGFAENTKDAIIVAMIRELALNVRGIVCEWAKRVSANHDDNNNNGRVVGGGEDGGNDDDDTTPMIQVVVTGGDGEILEFLLNNHFTNNNNNHSHQIDGALLPELERMLPLPKNLQVSYQRHLIHLGVAKALSMKVKPPGDMTPLEHLRHEIVGQRVAKQFPRRGDATGDDIYRGSVASVSRGGGGGDNKDNGIDNDFYKIYYDDGDKEDLTSIEVYEAMVLYAQVGEKVRNKETEELFKMKYNEAKAVAELLANESEAVKSMLVKRQARLEAKKRALEVQQLAMETSNKKPAPAESNEVVSPPSTEIPTLVENNAAAAKTPSDEKHPVSTPTTTPTPKKKRGRVSLKKTLEDNPTTVLTHRLAKYFGNDLYFGSITEYTPLEESEENAPFWRIVYDDGDEEDLEIEELLKCLDLYKKKQKSDPSPKP